MLEIAQGSLAVNQFVLVETVERLGQGIVVPVALGPHRGHDVRTGESLGVANA